MKDLKAAVIGTGGAGQLHLAAYAACAHTRPVAVVSRSAERAAAIAAEYGARRYTSVEAMLAAERPDVVSVATLEWEHEEPVLLSLGGGAHVLCEKIMAHTLAAGERMVAAAAHAGRTLGVNYNYRAVPALRLIRDAVAAGELGEPCLFAANMHAYLFPHWLDMLRFLFGDPVEVTAAMVDDQALRPPVSGGPQGRPWKFRLEDASENADPTRDLDAVADGAPGVVAVSTEMLYHPSIAATATFRFRGRQAEQEGDFLATLSGSALMPLEENFWSFALVGTGGTLTIDRATRANLNGTVALGAGGNSVGGCMAALPACSYAESFALSVGAFAEAIASGRPAPVSGADGLAALRLDAAMVEAAKSGRSLKMAE